MRALRTSPLLTRAQGSILPVSHDQAALASRNDILRVGVLGLGAIGTILFTRLGLFACGSKTGDDLPGLKVDALVKPAQFDTWVKDKKRPVSLDGNKSETLEFCVRSGDKVATLCQSSNVRIRPLTRAETSNCDEKLDVLFIAVKAYDSMGVIQELQERKRHLVREDALCVLLQNGLGAVPPEDKTNQHFSGFHLANGVTFFGGRVLRFGSVVTSGLDTGKTYIAPLGKLKGETEPVPTETRTPFRRTHCVEMETLAKVCCAAGIQCEVLDADAMQAMLWHKLIVNAAINPLASLLDAPNRIVACSDDTHGCVKLVVREALAVAKCEQVPLNCSENELVEEILQIACNTGTNVCSMLADLRRGSRTEIDAISGRIVAGGKRHGVPTPINELLLLLVKALEKEGTRRRTSLP